MKVKTLALVTGSSLILVSQMLARAAAADLIFDGDEVSAVKNFLVGEQLYNIDFLAGSFDEIFHNMPPAFLGDFALATEARDSLLGILNNNGDPFLTTGSYTANHFLIVWNFSDEPGDYSISTRPGQFSNSRGEWRPFGLTRREHETNRSLIFEVPILETSASGDPAWAKFTAVPVPESSCIFGLLALGSLGVVSTLKRLVN